MSLSCSLLLLITWHFFSESETWQCMLCTNVLDCSDDISNSEKRSNGMSAKELRIAQRIVLELYCQYEQSLTFREVVSNEVNRRYNFFLDIGIHLTVKII